MKEQDVSAIKLAKVFNVDVECLIGDGELTALDKDLLKNATRILKSWTK